MADLPGLRSSRASGVRAHIWANMIKSADWCAKQVPRTEWISTAASDPQFENLYDRFYAAMHDAAIVEHLAFTSALSHPDKDPYFDPARRWLLATAKTWRSEAHNKPDASKAYAVLRVVKALAVGYDVLFDRLTPSQRNEVRDTITAICEPYYVFFQDPETAGPGYNKHHGSVDASPFGVAALALLGDVDRASAWLDLAVKKHVDYLLPDALYTQRHQRSVLEFLGIHLAVPHLLLRSAAARQRRDLLAEFPRALPGRIALSSYCRWAACVPGIQSREPLGTIRPQLRTNQLLVAGAVVPGTAAETADLPRSRALGRVARFSPANALHHAASTGRALVLLGSVCVPVVRRYGHASHRKAAAVFVRVSRARGE